MSVTLSAACIQLNNTPDRAENERTAHALIRQAAAAGAQLIATPEFTCRMVAEEGPQRLEGCEPEEACTPLARYRALAAELGVWLLLGSLAVKVGPDKLANRSYLISANGDIVAKYDKIHLFDVDLPDGQSFRESAVFEPGSQAVMGATPWGLLGMSICFDVRFAALYRSLAQSGAAILSIPAAYSRLTGATTWEIFTRTRAAETGSFVLAPAQCGVNDVTPALTRRTWGHSMIIGPTGEILAQHDADEPGVIMAALDMDAVTRARTAVPALKRDRPFQWPHVPDEDDAVGLSTTARDGTPPALRPR